MASEVRAYIRHIRQQGYCMRAARDWFATHGLSWSDFVSHGIEASKLRATGDFAGIATADIAEKEANGG